MMKLYIERRDETIRVQKKINVGRQGKFSYRTIRSVTDTSKNYKDLLRWAEVVGHTLEERQS